MELSAPSPKNKKSHPEKISVFPKKKYFGMTADQVVN